MISGQPLRKSFAKRPCPVSLAAVCLLAALCGCQQRVRVLSEPPVPPGPSAAAAGLPTRAQEPVSPSPQLPENWQELAKHLTLADIVNIGLANNTVTQRTWHAARAAAAQVGVSRAAYLPSIDVDASFGHLRQSAVGGRFTFSQDPYGATATLNWLLFDFGGRSARLDQAWAALVAADYGHNAAIQDVVFSLQAAYYGFLSAKAQLAAAESNVQEAQVNLDAARKRHEVGVATIADVLRAQTALSEAQLQKHTLEGAIEALRGQLATTMGIPATASLDVGVVLPADIPAEQIAREVEPLVAQALSSRPDLAGARWQAEEALARLKAIKSQGWPVLSVKTSANRTYYLPRAFEKHDNNWSASVLVTFPLFTGFAQSHEVKKAEAEAEQRQAEANGFEQQVILEVWTGYAELKTAAQRVRTARDWLASAEESERVALAQYKQGVASILDLLSAQAALAWARGEEIQARADWFLALARLARATGILIPVQEEARGLPKNGEENP